MWLESRTVLALPSSRISSRISSIWLGSSPLVGSSRIQHLGIVEDGLSQSGPLPEAFGEGADPLPPHILQAAFVTHVVQPAGQLFLAQPAQASHIDEELLHVHIGIERILLGQIADAGIGGEGVGKDAFAIQLDLAPAGLQIAGHHAHGGGFTGAVGPQKAHDLAGFHPEAYPVHSSELAKAAREVLYLYHTYTFTFP